MQIRVIQNAPAPAPDPFRENAHSGPLIAGVRLQSESSKDSSPASTGSATGLSFNAIMADLNKASSTVQPVVLPASTTTGTTSKSTTAGSTVLASPSAVVDGNLDTKKTEDLVPANLNARGPEEKGSAVPAENVNLGVVEGHEDVVPRTSDSSITPDAEEDSGKDKKSKKRGAVDILENPSRKSLRGAASSA
jgi:hypothetical protein